MKYNPLPGDAVSILVSGRRPEGVDCCGIRVEAQGRDIWTTGTVIRENAKTFKVALNFDIYRNGVMTERFPKDRVFLQCDRPVPFPLGMKRGCV